jgi:hypothetical protein
VGVDTEHRTVVVVAAAAGAVVEVVAQRSGPIRNFGS